MRPISALCCALAVGVLPVTAFCQTWRDFQVGDLTRRALVYVPEGTNQPPLLISLHGMGIGAGWHQGGMMKFEPIADREKFVVVYPEADQDLRWDLGGTHDTDFMLAIIEQMSAEHGIDRSRVYASGFSMGGMFSYTLACKLPEVFAAIAPGNGYPLGGEFGCVNTRHVPIFHMHGTADDFVAYSGIHNFLSSKIEAYGCPTNAVRTEPYPPSNSESQSFKEHWGPCEKEGLQSEIILVSVTGMIHDWATAGKANANEDPAFTGKPFDIDGSEEAWAFLKTHSLDELGGTGGSGTGGSGTGGSGTGGTGTGGTGTGGTGTGGSGTGGIGTGGSGTGGNGTGGSGTGGSGTGGNGTGGSGTGGSGTGGTGTGGAGVAGLAVQPSIGGGSVDPNGMAGAGGENTPSVAQSREDSGCGCIVGRSSGSHRGPLGAALLLGLLLLTRTRHP